MAVSPRYVARLSFALIVGATGLAGCASSPQSEAPGAEVASETTSTAADKDCLMRAMYFESNRSSADGLLAVGSVVMNRVASGAFPNTICGVVGQRGQFSSGLMTKRMSESEKALVEKVADEVLAGKRHPKIGHAMHFHLAGLRFSFPGMHYVLVAGGNAFYEKRSRASR